MRRSWWLALAVLVLLELGLFAWWHGDIVALNGPRDLLLTDARFPDLARGVLAQERVSRRLLERVAEIAHARGDRALRVDVLARIAAAVPADSVARLRLAEALRDAGRLDEAAGIYRAELGLAETGGAR